MDKEELLEVEKHLIQAEILKQLEQLKIERGINQNDIAVALDVKPSFVSQLYHSNRFFSLQHLAKLKLAFDLTLNIQFNDRETLRRSKAFDEYIEIFNNVLVRDAKPADESSIDDFQRWIPAKQA